MILTIHYTAFKTFDCYYNKNKFDILSTLTDIESSISVSETFKNAFISYTDFLDAFDISEDEFNQAGCLKWYGRKIFYNKGSEINKIRSRLGWKNILKMIL